MDWPRGRIIGGSSSINAMIWVLGHPADFDHWACAGNDGWGYADLNPIFQSIETCTRKVPGGTRGASGPMYVGPMAAPLPLTEGFLESCRETGDPVVDDVGAPIRDGAAYMDLNVKDGRRFSVVHGYLLQALDRQNLTMLSGARVEKLLFEGGRCSGVRLRIGRMIRDIAAEQETILSAGAVDSPRLLLISGVGDAGELRRNGIPVVSDLPGVGENLQDHLSIPAFVSEVKTPIPLGSRAESPLFFRGVTDAHTADMQVLFTPRAVGTNEIEGNEGFSILLARSDRREGCLSGTSGRSPEFPLNGARCANSSHAMSNPIGTQPELAR
ncbi:MAG TPA: GMC family oxidoreductase N-terminal domain-containing protein [Acetobacteraceae bacterium]|nr:GMC family oxidoreductase N-terminal domain-containing protein [Acetobacteraceae bacterium]